MQITTDAISALSTCADTCIAERLIHRITVLRLLIGVSLYLSILPRCTATEIR